NGSDVDRMAGRGVGLSVDGQEAEAQRAGASTLLDSLRLIDFRGYAGLDVSFGPGPQLVWGPNAAGKTSLTEAIALLAWGRSHRTSTDAEMIRWGQPFARVDGRVRGARDAEVEVALVAAGAGQ